MIVKYKNGFEREVHTSIGLVAAIARFDQLSNIMEKQLQDSGIIGTIEIF